MSGDKLDKLDYYTLLGVHDDSTIPEIKAAFRVFARRYHPDRFAGKDAAKVEQAARIYRRGSEAYSVLTDRESRLAYDEALEKGELRFTADVRERAQREAAAAQAQMQKPKGPPIRSLEAKTYFQRAVALSKKRDYQGAWKALKAADKAEPNNPFLQDRLGQLERKIRGW